MTLIRARLVVLSAVFAATAMSACSGDGSPDTTTVPSDSYPTALTAPPFTGDTIEPALAAAAEEVTAEIAVVAGTELFVTVGYPLTGDLECMTAVIAGLPGVALTCTGQTVTGGTVVLSGPTTDVTAGDASRVAGDFAGNVDGTEVFRVAALDK